MSRASVLLECSGTERELDICKMLSSSNMGGASKRTDRGQNLNLNSNFGEEVAIARVNGCERSSDRSRSLLDQDPLMGISFDGQEGGKLAKSTVKKHSDGLRGEKSSKSMDYDRDRPRCTGISKHTCNVRVGGPRGKLRGPKGLKKEFLVQPRAYGAEDGDDWQSPRRERVLCFLKF